MNQCQSIQLQTKNKTKNKLTPPHQIMESLAFAIAGMNAKYSLGFQRNG